MARKTSAEYARQWYSKNKDRKHEINRAWARRNPQKMCSYVKKWQAANPEKTKQIYKNWVEKNPEIRRVTRKQSNHKRKAILRNVSFEDCSRKISILSREPFCHWCCTKLSDLIRTIDHVLPLSRGGHHIPDNLVASCNRCNFSRNDKLVEEWLPKQQFS